MEKISRSTVFVYKVYSFPFNAQQNIYAYHYFGVHIIEDSDNPGCTMQVSSTCVEGYMCDQNISLSHVFFN